MYCHTKNETKEKRSIQIMMNARTVAGVHTHTHTGNLIKIIKFNIIGKDRNIMLVLV